MDRLRSRETNHPARVPARPQALATIRCQNHLRKRVAPASRHPPSQPAAPASLHPLSLLPQFQHAPLSFYAVPFSSLLRVGATHKQAHLSHALPPAPEPVREYEQAEPAQSAQSSASPEVPASPVLQGYSLPAPPE